MFCIESKKEKKKHHIIKHFFFFRDHRTENSHNFPYLDIQLFQQ